MPRGSALPIFTSEQEADPSVDPVPAPLPGLIGCSLMKLLFSRFIKEEDGSTALEYGLIAAGLSIAIVTVLVQIAATFARLQSSSAAAGN